MQAETSPPEKSPHTASFEVSLQELGGVVSKLEDDLETLAFVFV